jgi:hypothetical protein
VKINQQFRLKKILLENKDLCRLGKNIFQANFASNLRQKAREAGEAVSYSL